MRATRTPFAGKLREVITEDRSSRRLTTVGRGEDRNLRYRGMPSGHPDA
jgi:hypothetical protein